MNAWDASRLVESLYRYTTGFPTGSRFSNPGSYDPPSGRTASRTAFGTGAILFVVYCNGPHCNGADKAALALARLGRKVKKMIGGIDRWKDDGLGLEAGA